MAIKTATRSPSDHGPGPTTDVRIPGVLFLVLGAAFIVSTMLAASIAPGYDMHGGKISDLGVIGETAALFNVLLIAIGVLNVVGGFLLYLTHDRLWLLAIYLAAAIGSAGAGVFPLSTGGVHGLFALLAFVAFNAEALGTATVVSGLTRVASVVAGTIGLIYVVIMVIGDSGNPAVFGAIGHGGSERMIAYPVMLWFLMFGGYLIGARERRESADDRRARDGSRVSGPR